jgi:micrococcal nuclease
MQAKRTRRSESCLLRAVILILLICMGYALYRQFIYSPAPVPEEGQAGLRMTEIIDGDTGLLSTGEAVRFLGIDSPENGEPFYFEAKRMTTMFCMGAEVRLEYDHRKRDKYGRILAYVFVEDTAMVNEALIRAGLASVYIFPYDQKNMDYRERLIAAQAAARGERKGIWSLPPPEPVESTYLGNPNTFRFHRPSCRSLRRSDRSNLLEYRSRGEFLDSGFSPCRICKP